MRVTITEWALCSYLELKHQRVFTVDEYKKIIRPDVELLKQGMPPTHPKFDNDKFWGPVTDRSGRVIPNAYKMKWHNIGNGKVQLRLLVVQHDGRYLLCQAYVKKNPAVEAREAAKLKIRMRDILRGAYTTRGEI